MAFRIAAFLLVISTVAHAALIAGPEQPVSTVEYGVAPALQSLVAVASDGQQFEVLWTDGYGTYASHVDASGQPVAQVRLMWGAPYGGAICWSGDAYIIAWIAAGQVNVATLNRAGAIVRAAHSTGVVASSTNPISIASNGTSVLIAFADSNVTAIHAVQLDREGDVIKPNVVVPIASAAERLLDTVKVATNGDTYAIFWETSKPGPLPGPPQVPFVTTLYAARFGSSGELLNAPLPPPGTFGSIGQFDVAYARGRYALVGVDNSSNVLRRFVVDPTTLTMTALADTKETRYGAHLISNGDQFVAYGVAADSQNASFLALASFEADTADAPLVFQRSVAAGNGAPRLASNGTSLLFAWSNGTTMDIALDRNFNPSAQRAIGLAPRQQVQPLIVAGPGQSLVIWFEQTSTTPWRAELRATRITGNGVVLDREPLVIGSNDNGGRAAAVAIADGYFVAWSVGGSLQGRRIERDGSLSAVVTYATGGSDSPAVAANANTMLLVDSGSSIGLRALRLTPYGKPIDRTPLFLTDRGFMPQVATNGSDFLVVWTEGSNYWQFPSPDLRDVYGVRVTSTGAVDAAPIAISSGPADQAQPSVASDGRDYVVVYESGTNPATLAAKRVLREGQLADTAADAVGAAVGSVSADSLPVIVRADTGYFAGWETGSQLYVRHLDDRGNPDGDSVLIASRTPFAEPSVPLSPSLASGTALPLFAVYSRVIDDLRSPVVGRVFLRAGPAPPRRRTVK